MHSRISKDQRLTLVPKYTGGECGEQTRVSAGYRETRHLQSGAAYGILHFIVRHIYLLMAIVGVCSVAAGQAAKQQPLAKPPAAAPAQQQHPSDEEVMAKAALATINGRQNLI
jgi:hypothetical protein